MANRTEAEDRAWLLKMAAAEEEALSECGGVLACSPEIYRMMMEAEEAERVKNDEH